MKSMKMIFTVGMSAFALSGVCLAQTAETEEAALPDLPEQADMENAVAVNAPQENAEDEAVSEDDMADDLNAQQQLQQTFKLKRTINGKVVDEQSRTVTYSRDNPLYETEAGMSAKEAVKAAFDGEVLTRTEAFEEADLDFTIADINNDGELSEDEFAELVASWWRKPDRTAAAPDEETARQRQYDAFLAELDPEAAHLQHKAYAKEKFSFMAGAAVSLSRRDYIREYLIDFYAMDANKDMLLKGEELMRFRALNRGETVEM